MTLDPDRKVACPIRPTSLTARSDDAEGGLDKGEEAYVEKLWREVHGDGTVSSGVVVRDRRERGAVDIGGKGGSASARRDAPGLKKGERFGRKRGREAMVDAAQGIPLGKNIEDGSEVLFSPKNGPLLIFGRSGKSLTVKKLLKRAAEAGVGPIFAYEDSASARYGELVRVLNGARKGADVFEHLYLALLDLDRPGLHAATTGGEAGNAVVSNGLGGMPRVRRARDELLHEVLTRRFGAGPPPHFFADGLDGFVRTPSAAALAGRLWESSRALGKLAVGGVSDGRAFLAGEGGRSLFEHTGSVLLMQLHEGEASAVLEELGPPETGGEHLEPREMWRHHAGSGVLYDRATRTARPISIDLAEGEFELFNTNPRIGGRG